MNYLKPVLFTVMVAACALPTFAADAPRRSTLTDLFGDETLARGKGVEVKQSQLDEAFIAYKANLVSRNQNVPEEQRTVREAQLLDRLITTQLLVNRVTDADRARGRELAEKFMAETRKGAGDDEAFDRHLRAMGLSREKFNKRVMEQALAEAVIEREIRSGLTLTDAQVKEFYDTGTDFIVKAMQEQLDKMVNDPKVAPGDVADFKAQIDRVKKANLAKLEQPEKVKVAHVFIATKDRTTDEELSAEQKLVKRQQAEKVRTRALAGEDFSKLVQEVSEDKGKDETKGEYTFTRSDSFTPAFKAAAFALKPGAVSDVVVTPFGLHVIKMIEHTPEQKVELAKATADLKEFLSQQQVQKAMPDFFRKLKQDAAVEVLVAKYRIDTGAGGAGKSGQ